MDGIYNRDFVWYSIVCQCDILVFFISVDHNNDPIGIILYNTWAPKMSSKLVVIVAWIYFSHWIHCHNIKPTDTVHCDDHVILIMEPTSKIVNQSMWIWVWTILRWRTDKFIWCMVFGGTLQYTLCEHVR